MFYSQSRAPLLSLSHPREFHISSFLILCNVALLGCRNTFIKSWRKTTITQHHLFQYYTFNFLDSLICKNIHQAESVWPISVIKNSLVPQCKITKCSTILRHSNGNINGHFYSSSKSVHAVACEQQSRLSIPITDGDVRFIGHLHIAHRISTCQLPAAAVDVTLWLLSSACWLAINPLTPRSALCKTLHARSVYASVHLGCLWSDATTCSHLGHRTLFKQTNQKTYFIGKRRSDVQLSKLVIVPYFVEASWDNEEKKNSIWFANRVSFTLTCQWTLLPRQRTTQRTFHKMQMSVAAFQVWRLPLFTAAAAPSTCRPCSTFPPELLPH